MAAEGDRAVDLQLGLPDGAHHRNAVYGDAPKRNAPAGDRDGSTGPSSNCKVGVRALAPLNSTRAWREASRFASGISTDRRCTSSIRMSSRNASGASTRRRARLATNVRDQDLYISAVTIGEIQSGVEITREQDQAKAAAIEAWWSRSPEPTTSSAWTHKLSGLGAAHASSTDALIEDAMIASTAAVHHLTVVTRNMRAFEGLGVVTLNPFATKAG